MGWQVINAVVLHAGNTIINPNGMFVYSGAPALGNLIFSAAPAAGTDSFGNSYVEGAASYVTIAGTIYALEVGSQTGSGNAFLVHNLTSPPSADPLFSAIEASPAGCVAAVLSGKSAAASGQASVQVADSVASGVTGGEIDLVSGHVVISGTVTGGLAVTGGITTDAITVTGANATITPDLNMNPLMATPPNAAAVAAGTATLAQTEAFCNGLYQSMKNRGMFN